MKNILHMIETSGPGGAENMMIRLIENLDKNKYYSVVCLLKDGWLNQTLQGKGIDTVIIPQTKTLDYGWLKAALKLLKTKNIDLMHSHEFAMNTYASILSILKGIPCVTTVHGKNYYWEKFHRRLAYKFTSRISIMVAVSNNIKQFLIKKVNIKQNRILVIHNGINISAYEMSDKKYEFRKNLGIDNNCILIGAIGNLYPVKGHMYLIEALALVKQSHLNVQLIITGRGNQLSFLEKEVKRHNLNGNVKFLGFRDDVPNILNAIDMFVMPSLSEGLPLSILESMAANCPVIATNVGGIPEVVIDSTTGFLVESRDPQQLAEKIIFCIENKREVQKAVANAKEKIINDFSMKAMLNRYSNIYDDLLVK